MKGGRLQVDSKPEVYQIINKEELVQFIYKSSCLINLKIVYHEKKLYSS